MKKLFIIRREDVFLAIAKGITLELGEAGSLWCSVRMSLDERANYPFPIWDYD